MTGEVSDDPLSYNVGEPLMVFVYLMSSFRSMSNIVLSLLYLGAMKLYQRLLIIKDYHQSKPSHIMPVTL